MKKNVSKIMLMYPNLKWTDWKAGTSWDLHPYNLGILAAMIEDEYEVKIIDGTFDNLSKDQFANIISKEKPDILGISILTNEYGKTGFVASQIAKENHPEVKTVIGGVHATSLPEFTINNPNVDYVVTGEGEYVFRDLCDFLNKKSDLPKGILYKKNGKIINTGRADFIKDLDKIPYPAYHNVNFMKYATQIQRESIDRPKAIPFARTMTSRGCPYNCCFCEVETLQGKRPRLRSLENVLGEIEWLIKDHGIRAILFDDDNLLINKKRAKNLFKAMIDRKYNLKWNAPALALYQLDEEMIGIMKESGCSYVQVAIESGVQRVLDDIIHKPLNLKHARKMLQKLKEFKIDTSANFIVGFPGETWDEIEETFRFAEDIDVDYVKIALATPLPNTELYRIAREKGYLVDGFHFNQHLWTDGWIETEEFKPQDLKILRAYERDRINFSRPEKREKIAKMMDVTEERLNEIRKEALK